MIFARLIYQDSYDAMHDALVRCVMVRFPQVEHGLQGDSWIWIHIDGQMVAIDTFTAEQHEVKSACAGPHVDAVIRHLHAAFRIEVLDEPALEGHE